MGRGQDKGARRWEGGGAGGQTGQVLEEALENKRAQWFQCVLFYSLGKIAIYCLLQCYAAEHFAAIVGCTKSSRNISLDMLHNQLEELLHSSIAQLYCTALLHCSIALLCCTALLHSYIALIYCTALLHCSVALLYCPAVLHCYIALLYCIAILHCSIAVLWSERQYMVH